jgi:NAD(P)-dependent dehydrogenase (short-subunit alcohol dehydrogenase family)
VNRVPYAAAKGGVDAITACLAFEYAEHGIRVCGVAPGATEAPPRRIPRNAVPPIEQEKVWYQQIVDQALCSSPMKRYGAGGGNPVPGLGRGLLHHRRYSARGRRRPRLNDDGRTDQDTATKERE